MEIIGKIIEKKPVKQNIGGNSESKEMSQYSRERDWVDVKTGQTGGELEGGVKGNVHIRSGVCVGGGGGGGEEERGQETKIIKDKCLIRGHIKNAMKI